MTGIASASPHPAAKLADESALAKNRAFQSAHTTADNRKLADHVRRTENMLGLVISAWLVIRNYRKIHWPTFVALFSYIDLIGYLPGLARVYQKKSPEIERGFYWAYNLTHTFLTAIPIAALATWRYGRPWSALGIFIHLFGDRGLLGNFMKIPGGEFEHFNRDDV